MHSNVQEYRIDFESPIITLYCLAIHRQPANSTVISPASECNLYRYQKMSVYTVISVKYRKCFLITDNKEWIMNKLVKGVCGQNTLIIQLAWIQFYFKVI